MSKLAEIEQALLAVAKGVVPSLTTDQQDINLDQVPGDQYPYAWTVQNGTQIDALDYLQDDQQWDLTLQIATNLENSGHDEMYAVLEAIRDAIYTDRTLGGVVDGRTRAVQPAVALAEIQGQTRRIGALTLQAFLVL